MTDLSSRLSAYLDGELEADDARAIERCFNPDPAAQAELDALMAADAMAQDQFAALLDDPVPLALAQKIRSSPVGMPCRGRARAAQVRRARLRPVLPCSSSAARGGYLLKDQIAPEAVNKKPPLTVARCGLAERHRGLPCDLCQPAAPPLVEVAADEADHIEKWLGATVGVALFDPGPEPVRPDFRGRPASRGGRASRWRS